MVIGWQWIDGKCYYFEPGGTMATDTWIGNYYVDESGVWVPGAMKDQWILSGNRWWYRHADGSCTKSDWERIDGNWYYFDEAGSDISGMSDDELMDQSEVFAIADGRFLVVEG